MTDLAIIRAEVQADTEDLTGALAVVRGMPCETSQDLAQLNDVFTLVRDQGKELAAKQAAILDPLKASAKAVKDLFAPAIQLVEALEKEIRAKIADRAQRQLAADNAARAAALEASRLGDSAGVSVALAQVSAAPAPGLGNLAVTYGWDYQIADLELVPREWLTLDVSKVKIHCRENAKRDAIPPVAGLTFTRTTSTRAKP